MKKTASLYPWADERFSFTRIDLFIKLILLFPIATLLQHHVGILNKLLFAVSLVIIVAVTQFRRKDLLYLIPAIGLWLLAVLITEVPALKTNFNMTFYFIFLELYLIFFLRNRENIWTILNRSRGYILAVVVVYTLIVAVSIFLPSSYIKMTAGGWGDESYFASISGSPNRVGPASVFTVVLLAFLVKTGSSKLLVLFSIPNLYVFLMGGSRTYFVLGLCAMVVLFYVLFKNKKHFFAALIPLGLIGIVLVLNSSMMNKFTATFQQGLSQKEFWRRLTNTRSVFWVDQLKMFFATPWYRQLFGNGINFTTYYYYGLWAHSDFIEILCSYGYIGLISYVSLMGHTIHTLLKTAKKHALMKLVCFFIWFFNAFFNFFYCYFCAMLCYPILLLLVGHMDDEPTYQGFRLRL